VSYRNNWLFFLPDTMDLIMDEIAYQSFSREKIIIIAFHTKQEQ
jgi:hypothetical protein